MSSHINQNGQQTNALVDAAFHSISKNKPGFWIWRIEGMQLNSVPKDSYGVFYKGDVYLIYHSVESSQPKVFSQHIHLWIGSDSSQDEQGVGAFKMAELDSHIGGWPIEHRECQNYESERFLSYFRSRGGSVRYLNGGFANGFHHHTEKSPHYRFEPRLYQVKGKRSPARLNELSPIDWTSLNRSDVFLLDLLTVVFVWSGKNAIRAERWQALSRARQFREERSGQCNVVCVDDGEEKDMGKEELKLFEAKFPLKDKVSKLKNEPPLPSNTCLEDFKYEMNSYIKLYRCSDARDEENGTVKIKIIELKSGPLQREDLTSDDSYIVDNGRAGIWVWIGKRSSPKERQEAMRNALGFLQAKGIDEKQQYSIKVTRVIEAHEPLEFRALFQNWPDLSSSSSSSLLETSSSTSSATSNGAANVAGISGGSSSTMVGSSMSSMTSALSKSFSLTSIAKSTPTSFDATLLAANPSLAADSQLVDDGKSFKQLWFAHNGEIHKLAENCYGEFHSADCYLVHYKYVVNRVEKHILYYWIGRKSNSDDQFTVALKAAELDNKFFEGKSLLVRLCEGKECNHFMAMFDGRIVIYQKGRANSGNRNQLDSDKMPDTYMLQVKSYGQQNIKAIQVDNISSSALNTNDVFIICSRSSAYYIWCGKRSTGDEREAAKSILAMHKREPEMVIESQERDEFWQALGGRKPYTCDKRPKRATATTQQQRQTIVRLFEITNLPQSTNASGGVISAGVTPKPFLLAECYQFVQEDLSPQEVMLLDIWDSLFVWIGSNVNKNEKIEIDRISNEYMRGDPSQRGIDIPVYKVKQGLEPPIFTGFFPSWDSNLWTKVEPDYQSIKSELHSKNQAALLSQAVKDKKKTSSLSPSINGSSNNVDFNKYPKYAYEDLIKPADQLPECVNTEFKEVHLNEIEFQRVFNMTYVQFRDKPLWKQKELKRSVRLF